MKAEWNGALLAQSNDTLIVENNHYFPADSLNREFFKSSNHTSHCPWKGDASYYNVIVNGTENIDAAWYYPEPKSAAAEIKGRVAFWRGVIVSED